MAGTQSLIPTARQIRRLLGLEAAFSRLPKRYELLEVFDKLPALNAVVAITNNLNFEVLGTNATTALPAFNARGGMTLTTAGADNDQMIVLPHLDAEQTAWTTFIPNHLPEWECVVELPSIASVNVWAGLKLTNTNTVATDADQAYFVFDPGADHAATASANWQVIHSVNGTDVETTLGSRWAVAANTRYRLGIKVPADLKARFYIDGVLVHTAATAFDGTEALIPYVAVEASTGSAKTLNLYWERVSRSIAN